MLKRIAVIGENAVEWAGKETGQDGLQFVPVEEDLPVGAVALVAAGTAPNLVDLVRQMGMQHETLFHLLSEAVDAREGILPGSSERLKEHASRFAQALNLSVDEQYTLERGALLHDIGKTRIPNDILLKKSVLTYDEWVLLQQHTTLGADLLVELKFATDTVDIIRYHHECYDGDGYPDRLERDNIPYMARMMKILDVYCAMTSPRHYRSTHSSHEDALKYLEGERGKHYDPELIDVFIGHEVGQPLHR